MPINRIKKEQTTSKRKSTKSSHLIEWIESNLVFSSKGGARFYGKPFKLLPWQKDFLRELYSNKGVPRKRFSFVGKPRKIGMTELACSLAVYSLFNNTPQSIIYVAAELNQTSRVGLDVVRDLLVNLKNKSLAKDIKSIRDGFENKKTNSTFRILTSNAPSLHGQNISLLIVDELHAIKDEAVLDILISSQGVRENPLTLIMTTPADDPSHFSFDYYRRAKKGDKNWVTRIFECDPKDDPTKESTWRKCNPSYGKTVTKEFYESELERSKRSSAGYLAFRRLLTGCWLEVSKSGWVDVGKLRVAPKPSNYILYGGLDISTGVDLTAYVLCYVHEKNKQKHFHLESHFWIPSLKFKERKLLLRDKYNLDNWKDWIHVQSGSAIDQSLMAEDITKLERPYFLGYDPWNCSHLISILEDRGMACEKVRQGGASHTEPIRLFESALVSDRVTFDGSPVLLWCFNNSVVQEKSHYVSIHRASSRDRIDGAVATINSLYLHLNKPAENALIGIF